MSSIIHNGANPCHVAFISLSYLLLFLCDSRGELEKLVYDRLSVINFFVNILSFPDFIPCSNARLINVRFPSALSLKATFSDSWLNLVLRENCLLFFSPLLRSDAFSERLSGM